jgi:hypothetical protein
MIGLLAEHLLSAPLFRCPGADGATIEDVVAAEYPAASAAGWVPRLSELTICYPDLSNSLACFFGNAA